VNQYIVKSFDAGLALLLWTALWKKELELSSGSHVSRKVSEVGQYLPGNMEFSMASSGCSVGAAGTRINGFNSRSPW
jgi:hypothetical protein